LSAPCTTLPGSPGSTRGGLCPRLSVSPACGLGAACRYARSVRRAAVEQSLHALHLDGLERDPSIPGAPSFCLAIAYAARRVSILQTWTYRPQKRQDGSAFALTYSLRLRSCNSMDAFVISSLPSLRWRHCKWQGPFAPRILLRFPATTDPAATLSSSADFPVLPVIRPTLLRRFRAGTRRASPVAQHVLVTVLSLPPRRGEQPYRSVFGCSCCLRPSEVGSALGATFFEATMRSLLLRPGDS
jgi:hypothetical protein